MRNYPNRVTKRAGFTLIELLVVIAIVAVIAAILFPVFASVRERGRRTVCQSNLKQIGVAMQQYVQDNGGTYPLSMMNAAGEEWQQRVFPYVKSAQVFHCPDRPSDAGGSVDPTLAMNDLQFVDYTYNMMRLNTFLPPYPSKNIQGARESMLATPSSIWLNVDASWISADGIYHYGREVPKTSCGRSFSASTLHSNAGTYSYLDGHVKWLTPEEAGEIECLNGPLPAPFKD